MLRLKLKLVKITCNDFQNDPLSTCVSIHMCSKGVMNQTHFLASIYLTGIHLKSCIQDHFGHKLSCRHHNFLNIRI
jgi:hypothetical protein